MAVTLSADEEAVIKKRLLTQTTVARLNADPPLKKVAKRFAALAAASEKGLDRDSVARLHSQLLRELALFEFQLSRAVTVCGANGREQALYAQQHGRLEQGIEQTLRDIQVLKVELEGARLERRRQEEYEELRKQCMQHPSRSQTRAAIASVTEDIVALETEGQATAETVEARKRQVAALLASVDQLLALDTDTGKESAPMQID